MVEPIYATDDIALDGPLLFGRVLDGKGSGRRIDWDEARTWQPSAPGEVIWLHLCRNLPGAAEWLGGPVGVPEPSVEMLTSDATRPRAFRERDTLVATLLRRYLDDLDISKESALVLQDDIRARSAARSERTNYLLTIVAAIFLPLGFLTGLLGINVGGMPGVDDGHAFWVVVGLCGAVFVMLLALFWKWKWL